MLNHIGQRSLPFDDNDSNDYVDNDGSGNMKNDHNDSNDVVD
jgi:hypothetical protein